MFLYYNLITDLDKKALLKEEFFKYFKLRPNQKRPNLVQWTVKIHLI